MQTFATFLACIVSYDAWFYLVHRLLHVPCLYRRFHYQHHQKRHPTWQDTMTAHAAENAVSGLGVLWPMFLTNASMHGCLAAWLFCFARGFARHDARCAWLVGTHHLMHHTQPDANFSAIYVDWICGTVAR